MDHLNGESFTLKDELYKFKEYDRVNQRVLATVDTQVSPKGAKQRTDNDHALAWLREYGKGKVFVSAFRAQSLDLLGSAYFADVAERDSVCCWGSSLRDRGAGAARVAEGANAGG